MFAKAVGAALLLFAAAPGFGQVAFYRPNAAYDAWRESLPAGGYAEWDFSDAIPDVVTELGGTSATQDYAAITPLMVNPSVQEFAAALSPGGVPCSLPDGCYFGGGHGNLARLSKTVLLDGADVTAAVYGSYLTGSTLVMTQTFNVLLPSDGATVAGTYTLTHTLTSSGLLVDKVVSFASPPQFEWWSVYAAMLSLQGFDHLKVGSAAPEPILSPATPNTKDRGSTASTFVATSAQHPFVMTLTLPTGYPDSNRSWARCAPDCAFWIDQAGTGGVTGSKLYVGATAGEWSYRRTAFTTEMIAHYQIAVGGTK